ncbi:MAG TPA: HTH domain-containing protein [Vicinamibacteria bacterium]|nr:HTH domain-containing protein [Vicinamibacteria bacterium]
MPSTRPPLRRLFWTLGQLRAGRTLKATDIARHFEVGVRTAYRDLDFLRDQMGAPIEYDRARASYELTDPTAPLPHLTLSQGELVALFFAEKVVRQYRGTPWEKDLEQAFRKIQSLMPEEVRVRPDRLESILSLDLGPLPRNDAAVGLPPGGRPRASARPGSRARGGSRPRGRTPAFRQERGLAAPPRREAARRVVHT